MQYNKIILPILSLFLLVGCDMIFYTPYIPLYRNSDPDHTIENNESLLTPEHIKYMQVVLDKNNEKFYVKGDTLYIKKTLSRNEDLLSNYTMKAIYMEKYQ